MAGMEGAHLDEGYATAAGASKDGPVLSLMSKRLRALKKKYTRILQIEDGKAQGRAINREQEEVLKTKIAVAILIDEYEKLRQPLQAAVKEELSEREREMMSVSLERRRSEEESAENEENETKEEVQKEVVIGSFNEVQEILEHRANGSSNAPEHSEREVPQAESEYSTDESAKPLIINQKESILRVDDGETLANEGLSEEQIADLLSLLYFARLFDVRSESELPSFVWTKVHERSSCLSYDFVFDDASAPLTEGDLDALSMFGSLLISRPPNVTLSHKDALRQCIQHARLWLSNSDSNIHPVLNISYTSLRERLNKILSSEYFTKIPELQTVSQQTAAAAAATAANQYLSQVFISDAVLDNQISEVEVPSVHDAHQVSSRQQHFEEEDAPETSLPAASGVPVEDPIVAVNPSNAYEDSSMVVDAAQHLIGQENGDQIDSRLEQEAKLHQETNKPLPPARPRHQQNPQNNGRDNRRGGYQGARGSGRGYGYGMGGRGRGYANGRGSRGGRGYFNGRAGQFYDQGGFYEGNLYGGRNGRGRAGVANGYVNDTSTTIVT